MRNPTSAIRNRSLRMKESKPSRPLRRGLQLVAAGSALALIAACGADSADETPAAAGDPEPNHDELASITIAEQGTAGTNAALQAHVADEFGFFEEQGLAIDEYISVTSSSDAYNGMLAGDIQVGIVGADGPIAKQQGAEIVGIGASLDASAWTVIAARDIDSWDDLRGGEIAVGSISDVTRAVFDELARLAGLDPDADLTYIEAGGPPERMTAVESGQMQATLSAFPTAQRAIDSGLTDLGFAPEGHEPPSIMITDITAAQTWADEHPEQVVGFLRAIADAREMLRDPAYTDEIAEYVATLTDNPVENEAGAIEMYWVDPPSESYHPPNFRHIDGAFDAGINAYLELGLLSESIAEDDFMDYSFADEAIAGE